MAMDDLMERIMKATGDELEALWEEVKQRAKEENERESSDDSGEDVMVSAKPRKKDKHSFTPTERVTLDYNGKF